jgi:superfamily II DNA or RNA helicase
VSATAVTGDRPSQRVGETGIPDVVLKAAAAASGLEQTVLDQAIRLALAGRPDQIAPGWWEAAACRAEHVGSYYPRHHHRDAKRRLATCRETCPVQAACLAAALAFGEHDGIWGGTTGSARRRLRRVLRQAGVLGVVGEDAHIAWSEASADREPPPPAPTRPAVTKPWPHQLAAVDAIADTIPEEGSCQVAIATASGKTLIGAWSAARLDLDHVLVMVPNLALIAQTAEVWAATEHWGAARSLAVCGDTGELTLPSTTDPGQVRSFLAEPGRAVVYATYQSSPVLVEAGCRFDLAIADEAHHLAGAPDKAFGAIVRGEILAARRLYMTATPRRFARRKGDVALVSMSDDQGSFGPRVFDFPLSDAVDAGVVADYRVIVAAVERDTFERVAAQPDLADLNPHLLAGAIAVVRAMGEFGLTSCLSFHNRVDRARRFAELVGAVAEALPAARPAGPGWAGWVDGASSVRIRRRLLARLADPHTWGVMANAKALGEGVDVPALDAVAIVDPKSSETDVLQATGRALRRATSSKIGTVILPVLLTSDSTSDDPLAGADERSLQLVGGVLRALRAHDAELGARLDRARRSVVRRPFAARPDLSAVLRRRAARRLLQSRIELWVPGGATGDLACAMALRLVREATPSWEEAFGRLLASLAEHGTARVPQTTKVPDETGTFSLGAWCTVQRGLHRRGLLAPERASRLDELPGWDWDPRENDWWSGFDALAGYVATHNAYPPQGAVWQGRKVGVFLNEVRTAYKADGWLTKFPDRVAALEALPGWAWNQRHANWEDHYEALAAWARAHGHARPSHGELVDGFDIGRWTAKQRAKIRAGRLDSERTARLRALPGWLDHTIEALWEDGYRRLIAWTDAHGTSPAQKTVLDDGFQLGVWVASQRERWRRGRLDPRRAERLEAIPAWSWTPHAGRWEQAYDRLVAYAARHGSVMRLPDGKVDGFDLAGWATNQRIAHARGELPADRATALEQVPGWVWSVHDARFEATLAALRSFAEREGHCEPPSAHCENAVQLRASIYRLRREHQLGELAVDRVERLEAIEQWSWDPPGTQAAEWDAAWDRAYERLARWATQTGHARPRTDTVLDDGFRLGSWVNKQRGRHRTEALSADRVDRLVALPGWAWTVRGSDVDEAPPDAVARWTSTVTTERRRRMADAPSTDLMTQDELTQAVSDQRTQLDRWSSWQEDLAEVLSEMGILHDVVARLDNARPGDDRGVPPMTDAELNR